MKGNIFHLLNRGVEKRKIFLNDENHIRFIDDMRDFNNKDNATMSYHNRRKYYSEVRPPNENESLVDIVCWTLMPNHPHLMVVEKEEGDVSKFSRKIFGGYTMYFNEQNKRSGVLFQGNTKIIKIKQNAHLLHLPFYIHLNPLDLFQPGWKENGIKNIKGAIRFIEEYRWSNYRDIIGIGNGEFTDATNRELFFKVFQTNPKKYKKDLEGWIKNGGYREDFNKFE